ncbi:peptide ABC transporter substrate-binding protein [Lentilactobacillus diolivorans]|uniref:Peptide ABC substrate-binding protein n=1 Tax=Lentilactobacillus diolivorans TaxID=179838 RepID=A0ABQ0XFD9_9LACO|nr:peptide ABC transporter substrate-binding protein [Lentilactobacillus diolivorans]GEP24772.1 peptide ABC substrate-binding protein [Lentilactobacillus diolivorans]
MVNRLRNVLWAAAVAVPLSLLLVGCGQKSSSSSNKQDLNLVEANDPTTLDVNDVRNSNEFDILNATQEGLFRTVSKNGKDSLQLAGAKSYTVSKDGLRYTFKLRSSKWSDGKPVVAQDYVDSVLRELNPKNGFAYSTLGYDVKNAQKYNTGKATAASVGVKAPNKSTFQITLAHPTANFLQKLSNIAFYPVRLDLINKHGNKSWKTDWKDQVSNGAFKITQWKTNDKIVLKKNSKFWNAKKVKLQKVTYISSSKDATISALLQSGQLDAVEASGTQALDFKKIAKSGKLNVRNQLGSGTNLIVFNQKTGGTQGLLKNTKIRKALTLAIDRKQYDKIISSGQEQPAQGYLPGSVTVGGTNYRKYAGNILAGPEKQYNSAAKLKGLFQQGLKELGKSTNLSKVKLVYLTENSSSDDSDIISFIKQQYKDKLGITVKSSSQPDDASFIAQRDKGNYDLLTNGWFGDYNDPETFLELWDSSNGFQRFFGGYKNASYDKLFDSLSKVKTDQQRLKIYTQLEKLLITKDFGVAPTTVPKTKVFISKSLHGYQTPIFGPTSNYIYAYKK